MPDLPMVGRFGETVMVPRRICVDQFTPAEKAIWDAVAIVEAAGASVALTDAVMLLSMAREKVADHVDGMDSGVAAPATPSPIADMEYEAGINRYNADVMRKAGAHVEGATQAEPMADFIAVYADGVVSFTPATIRLDVMREDGDAIPASAPAGAEPDWRADANFLRGLPLASGCAPDVQVTLDALADRLAALHSRSPEKPSAPSSPDKTL